MVDLHVAPQQGRVNKKTSFFPLLITIFYSILKPFLGTFQLPTDVKHAALPVFVCVTFLCGDGSLLPQCVMVLPDGWKDGWMDAWRKVGRLGWIREHVILEMV